MFFGQCSSQPLDLVVNVPGDGGEFLQRGVEVANDLLAECAESFLVAAVFLNPEG